MPALEYREPLSQSEVFEQETTGTKGVRDRAKTEPNDGEHGAGITEIRRIDSGPKFLIVKPSRILASYTP